MLGDQSLSLSQEGQDGSRFNSVAIVIVPQEGGRGMQENQTQGKNQPGNPAQQESDAIVIIPQDNFNSLVSFISHQEPQQKG
jgi:hypothetical protein